MLDLCSRSLSAVSLGFALALPAAGQSTSPGFDFLGPDNSLVDGNPSDGADCATYASGRFGGLTQVGMLFWGPSERMAPKELWMGVVCDRQDVANRAGSIRVSIWDSPAAMLASPGAGNVLDRVVAAPSYGSWSTPIGSTDPSGLIRPIYRIGVDLRGADAVLEPGTNYLIGVNIQSGLPLDTVWNGFGLIFSDIVDAPSYMWDTNTPTRIQRRRRTGYNTVAIRLVASDAVLPVGDGCGPTGGAAPVFSSTDPALGGSVDFRVSGMPPQAGGALVVSFGAPSPITLGPCTYYPDLATQFTWATFLADGQGQWTLSTPLPPLSSAEGLKLTAQGMVIDAAAPFGASLTNGLQLTFRSNHP